MKATDKEIQTALYGRKKGARIQVCPPEERTWNGIVFASGKEMKEYVKFVALERSGIVRNLRRQVRFPLHAVRPDGVKVKVSEYIADIVCEDQQGQTCVYDPKGMKTDKYKTAKKWFEVEYFPLRIVEL